MAFATTVQAAILTIIGNKLLNLEASSLLLSLIAVFVLFLGFNSERRLSGYMVGYMQRAKEIESEYGMKLLTFGRAFKNEKLIVSNSIIFPLYYCFFFIA